MKQENGSGPMDEDSKVRLEALAELPDSGIDTSDIKEWSDDDFKKAAPFHHGSNGKKANNIDGAPDNPSACSDLIIILI